MKPSELPAAAATTWLAGRHLHVEGPPGFGKTSILVQTAREIYGSLAQKERDVAYVFRLADRGLEAMHGLKVPGAMMRSWGVEVPESDLWKTLSTATDWFPRDGDGVYLLLFDELSQAEPSKQAWAREVILERRLTQDIVLPDYVVTASTGNRIEDNSAVFDMPRHVKSSIVTVSLEPHLADWKRWMARNNGAPEVLAFLTFREDVFNTFNPDKDTAYGCARSWHILSDVYKHVSDEYLAEIDDVALPENVRALLDFIRRTGRVSVGVEEELYAGIVGTGEASAYMGFLEVRRGLPRFETIFAQPETAPLPQGEAATWALAFSLARKANDDNFAAIMKYVSRFPQVEYACAAIDLVIASDPALQYRREFIQFVADHRDVVIGTT